jgi:hypothetical protein
VQTIYHPRPVIQIAWRSQPSSRSVFSTSFRFDSLRSFRSDQYVLYTTTVDAALRIFYPVLDAPRHLQLHLTVDPYSFLPSSLANNTGSPVFPLNREHLRAVVGGVLRKPKERNSFDESQRRRLTELHEEGWDLFARILDDGSIVIRAVAVGNHLLTVFITDQHARISIGVPQHCQNSLLYYIHYSTHR